MTLFVGIIPIISGYWKPIMTSLNRQFTCTCLCVNQLRMYSDAGVKPEKTSSESDVDTLAWEALVDYDKLSEDDLKIHQRHFQAVKNKKLMYTDPRTGYMVMTRLSHLDRGECCGNACRHCPYGQKNVPDELKKTFNSAFYV